jgi:hypothetical protein
MTHWLPLLALPLAASAQATIHVPLDAPTIQAAIELARDGDSVRVAAGTYPEIIDFLGKAITVASESGAEATTIDAGGFNPVVAFLSDEGEGSVLRGFTVTGGVAGGDGAGILCSPAARPRVEECVVRANRSLFGNGAGIHGSPRVTDCLIEGNEAPDGGGAGLYGAPEMRRCVVRGNSGYEGAGLQLLGGSVEDTRILANCCGEGLRGGGVSIIGPGVVLRRCIVAGNTVTDFFAPLGPFYSRARGGGVYVDRGLSAELVNCTIVANLVVGQDPRGLNFGGVFGPARLLNCIVRDNERDQLSHHVEVRYSNVQGFRGGPRRRDHPGPTNFDLEPLFAAAASGDYRLLPGSPCIDRGSPASPLDPDGSRADVGAVTFTHAVALVRNGSGVNPLALSSLSAPLLGGSWSTRIDAGVFPGATLSALFGHRGALAPGTRLPAGELLVDPGSPRVFCAVRPSSGALDDFDFALPADPALLGFTTHVQGAVLGTSLRLTNALELHLGQ